MALTSLTAGYSTTDANNNSLAVTITNTGNQHTGVLTYSLTGGHAYAFTVANAGSAEEMQQGTAGGINAGGNNTAWVTARPGLAPGTYNATVTYSGSQNGVSFSQSFNVSLTVAPPPQTTFGVEIESINA